MFSYDSTLLAAAQASVQTVDDVVRELTAIDQACIDTDGLKWFNWLYLAVTRVVRQRLGAGGLNDAAWLGELDVRFARLYFGALADSLAGRATPECWQVMMESRGRVEIARIQFALAGMNAHINHDLAAAIVATCAATGTAPDRGGPRYIDYTGLNATLDGLIDAARSGLNVRLPGDALPAVSRVEDTIAAWNVSAARESAWRSAEHLWQVRGVTALEDGFMTMLDGLTTVIGKALLVPAP